MKKVWVGLGLLLLLLAAGCGVQRHAAKSSRASTSASSRQVSASQKASSVPKTPLAKLKARSKDTLVYAPFGDSLSVGLFADKKASRFTSLFAQQLGQLTGKTVTEAGIAEVGKTATNLGVSALSSLVAQQPDVVTIEFGTNDAVGGATPSALAAYRQALTTIVTTLQEKTTAQLILMTTWSPNNGPYAAADLKFDAVVKEIGRSYHVPVANLATIWQGHDDVIGPAGTAIPDFAANGPRDTFHPNQKGHDQIAALLIKTLEE
ncbi:SGNH/GDSL hydrolase family protein [Lacticaseibacillus parahuelsenbergensis]|uniref:SGNH/GDSL hydrolase family protein n=1 Tax=Lacticaseibacillus parahuelsenbergensis TaxID=3068305 RepID=A0ABY9L633_9LACO|nr:MULTISPECIES: SGNH/GDSL hydrolase family protein [Lacticaseibacillus]MDE3282053.1 SGNH/GDSL hydrolase family protein [Lacticaseibacillus casei]WLV78945.1 SGNH/GDSL hydrolase family protein [Lacticaseibacillus sp. NCIMB 15471]